MEPIILNKKFQGPFLNCEDLESKPGVYVVICDSFGMTPFRVLDAGESDNVRKVLGTTKKRNYWKKNNVAELKFLVRYEQNDDARIELNKEIKKQFQPSA